MLMESLLIKKFLELGEICRSKFPRNKSSLVDGDRWIPVFTPFVQKDRK